MIRIAGKVMKRLTQCVGQIEWVGRQLETGPGLKRGARLSIRNLLAPNTAGLLSADSFYELLCSVQGKLSIRRPLHLDQLK